MKKSDGMKVLERWLLRLLSTGKTSLSESERQVMLAELAGVNLDSFRAGQVSIFGREYTKLVEKKRVPMNKSAYTANDADGNSLRAQADFVLAALGFRRMRTLVLACLTRSMDLPGSRVYTVEDRNEGKPEPLKNDVVEFSMRCFDDWNLPRGFSFDPTKVGREAEWMELAMHRMEAIVSVTYVLLRLLAVSEQEAVAYQNSEYFTDNFLRRLLNGQRKFLKAIGENDIPKCLEAPDKKVVRHLDPMILLEIWVLLTK